MGKRKYYCDYCDKTFMDDLRSRTKHIQGVHHEKKRSAYYALTRDLATLIKEEQVKNPCYRFHNQGHCPFEESCTFTHYTKEELASFYEEVKNTSKALAHVKKLPSLNDWLKTFKSGTVCKELEEMPVDEQYYLQDYNIAMLPPSLQPVSFSNLRNVNLHTWG